MTRTGRSLLAAPFLCELLLLPGCGGGGGDRTPPGIQKGAKLRFMWVADGVNVTALETRGKWVRVVREDTNEEIWYNCDNLVAYRIRQ